MEAQIEQAAESAPGGAPTSAVLKLLRARIEEQSLPAARSDSARLALAIEGGGMRGVVSAGMVAALEQLGASDAFDDIYGSSAGSFNGAYFISRRARLGTTIYYDDINKDEFIDLKRGLRGGPILCLDYMLNHVAETVKPLDWQGIIDSPIRLHPMATSLEEQRGVEVPFSTKDELKLALKASATIPWVAGGPVITKHGRFLDASTAGNGSIPYTSAVDDGATHVLALTTRPEGVLRGKPSFLERWFMSRKIRGYEPLLVPHYLARAGAYARSVEELRTGSSRSADDDSPHLYAITLARDARPVSQLEKDRRKLVAGAEAGVRAVFEAFGQDAGIVAHEIGAFPF